MTAVNPTYKPGEVLHQFRITGVKGVLVLAALCQALLEPVLRDYPIDAEHIITTNIVDLVRMSPVKKMLGRLLKKIPTGPTPPGALGLKALLATGESPPEVAVSADDIHTYIMTGGTTGVSKGVILTHANISKQAQQISAWFPRFAGTNNVNLGALPFFRRARFL